MAQETVQVDDQLDQRARNEAALTFHGDLSALVTAALRYYLDTQDSLRTLAAKLGTEHQHKYLDPVATLKANPNVLEAVNAQLAKQKGAPLDVAALEAGKAQIQPGVLRIIQQTAAAELKAPAPKAAPPAATAPPAAPGKQTAPAKPAGSAEPAPPNDPGPQTEDTVAQVIAASDDASAQIASVAQSYARIAEKVAELRTKTK